IRLEKLGASARNHQELVTKTLSSDQGDEYSALARELTSGTIIQKRRLRSHGHSLPTIHEDYYGPRHHLPRHH
nr:hypothetical protein [Tanacetum cinerariifolium]